MAQKVQVLLVCDLHDDDTEGDETVAFALDGAAYEIDLCSDHAAEMRDAFAGYVGSARRAGGRASTGRRTAGARKASTGGGRDLAAVREWARGQGITVSERGRIAGQRAGEVRRRALTRSTTAPPPPTRAAGVRCVRGADRVRPGRSATVPCTEHRWGRLA